jgi:galactonate dehydratase
MLRIGAAQKQADVAFAPHNPSGPVAHAASLEVCAAAAAVDYLEIQFDETPMFDGVLSQKGEGLSRPTVTLSPQRHGLGICVNPDLFNKDSNQTMADASALFQHAAGF